MAHVTLWGEEGHALGKVKESSVRSVVLKLKNRLQRGEWSGQVAAGFGYFSQGIWHIRAGNVALTGKGTIFINGFQGELMISQSSESIFLLCDKARHLGYARSKVIRIYGEEYLLTSDPFPEGGGVAVNAITRRDLQTRVLQLPLSVLHSGRQKPEEAPQEQAA